MQERIAMTRDVSYTSTHVAASQQLTSHIRSRIEYLIPSDTRYTACLTMQCDKKSDLIGWLYTAM